MPSLLADPAKLEFAVKTRIDRQQKQALETIARARQLSASDVLREALRFYLLHAVDAPFPGG